MAKRSCCRGLRWLWQPVAGGGYGSTPLGVFLLLFIAALVVRLLWRVPRPEHPRGDRSDQIADATVPHSVHLVVKPIEQVRPGDQVLAYDPGQRREVTALVRAVTRRRVRRLRRLRFQGLQGRPIVQVDTTDDHPFWTRERKWVPAAQLRPGTVVEAPGRASFVVTWNEAVERPEGVDVYNLTVAVAHNYYLAVGGKPALLVHNVNCVPLPRRSDWQIRFGLGPTASGARPVAGGDARTPAVAESDPAGTAPRTPARLTEAPSPHDLTTRLESFRY